jgi:uncharacterized protein YukE
MPQIGGEIEQMSQLSSTFTTECANIGELTARIDGQVTQTWWVGPAADRFREQWSGEFKTMLSRLQEALTDASAEVNRRREALVNSGS